MERERAPQGNIPDDWTRPIVDPAAFAEEQRRLASVWTFLGMTSDAETDGDWFRASIATRSVFVQRFGTELRGFENVCAHRFMPLRNAERGNGPITCGFHNWTYDRQGSAVGIPHCRELYNMLPQQLGARLTPIELATCGRMIFGRFPHPRASESLEDFLGIGFGILAAGSQAQGRGHRLRVPVDANWRLCAQISLDDYHSPTVHPRTFGRYGYLRRNDISYRSFGLHSAYLLTQDPQGLERIAQACNEGTYYPTYYTILQLVPTAAMAFFRSHLDHYHCVVLLYEPVRHDHTVVRAWAYPAPFPGRRSWTRRVSDPVRAAIVRRYVEMVLREDNRVCERIQGIAHQIGRAPLLGRLEERIGWFDDSYRKLMAAREDDD
jgi:phenylpropionate dioxygenase-like ring-hydroxylating dioxygenase large terminal subunit